MDSQTTEWTSPWSGATLTGEYLVREVALNVVCKLFVFKLLGYPRPKITIGVDFVALREESSGINPILSYPRELSSMQKELSDLIAIFELQYNTTEVLPNLRPVGEKLGEVLRYFRSLEYLMTIVESSNFNQSLDWIICIHGLASTMEPSELAKKLEKLGITYLFIFSESDPAGSGAMARLDKIDAFRVASAIQQGNPQLAFDLFNLENRTEVLTCASNIRFS